MKLKKFEHINRFDGNSDLSDEEEWAKLRDLTGDDEDEFDDVIWNKDSPVLFEGDDEEEAHNSAIKDAKDTKERKYMTQTGSDDLDPEQEDVVKELTYLLRKVIINSGIENFYVSNKRYDISIQFILQKKEKMGNIMKILTTLKKINDDILIQYDPEVELWENTKLLPMLTVDFYYEANKKGLVNAPPFK